MASNIALLPAIPSDIPTLTSVAHASFEKDAHTRFKALYANYHHGTVMAEPLKYWVRSDGQGIVLKAVDTTTNDAIVGWAAFKFVNFEYKFGDPLPSPPEPQIKQEKQPTLPPPPKTPLDPSKSKIDNLGALTNSAMTHYSTLLTPSPSNPSSNLPKCLTILSLSIHPSYQSLGIGTQLLNWGTNLADSKGAYSWVSSSHDGYHVFEKAGYVEVGRLGVRLDDFGKGEEEGNEWGEYVWRFLRRGVVV